MHRGSNDHSFFFLFRCLQENCYLSICNVLLFSLHKLCMNSAYNLLENVGMNGKNQPTKVQCS